MKRPTWKCDPSPNLIRRAQGGDREALRDLLREVEPSVRRWAFATLGDADAAADLCQEVLVLLVRKLSSYKGGSRFLTWLFSVTRNRALEELRRIKRNQEKMGRLAAAQREPEVAATRLEASVDRRRMSELLCSFVEELPPRQREVFHLSELEGLSSAEVAGILGVEPVSVRAALFKARRTLRAKILETHPEFVEEYLS